MKNIARKLLRLLGYEYTRSTPNNNGNHVLIPRLGCDPYKDIKFLLKAKNTHPVILDIGANTGQSVKKFKKIFPESVIHSFEPSPKTFEKLSNICSGYSNCTPWNMGIGSNDGFLNLHENTFSVMSSFLKLGSLGWGKEHETSKVPIATVTSFTKQHNIKFIDILKCDTQGFELEVFRGAKQLMIENKIGLIYFEFTFTSIYNDLPKFEDVFSILRDNRFRFITSYQPNFQEHL